MATKTLYRKLIALATAGFIAVGSIARGTGSTLTDQVSQHSIRHICSYCNVN